MAAPTTPTTPAAGTTPVPAGVDYARDVKPIFKQHCFRCHNASQQKGGLRLDTVEFMREGGDIGAGLETGNTTKSLIV